MCCQRRVDPRGQDRGVHPGLDGFQGRAGLAGVGVCERDSGVQNLGLAHRRVDDLPGVRLVAAESAG